MVNLLMVTSLLLASTGDSVWQSLRERYLGLESLSGSFSQFVYSETEGESQTFSGSFWSILPDRYRLEVMSPQRQVIVASDTVLWFYFPTEERAVREIQSRSMPLLAFLDPVLDPETTARIEVNPNGIPKVFVESNDDMDAIHDLVLELSADYQRIEAFEFADAWGNEHRFELQAQQWNPLLPPELFSFTPPDGTVVE